MLFSWYELEIQHLLTTNLNAMSQNIHVHIHFYLLAKHRYQWHTYREQITSEKCFFPQLDLNFMSSLFWQNLPILGVIIFNRLCGGKKKDFHSFFKGWVLQSFAGFWWDLVVWLKMGRDRQQVSDPNIKQWNVEGCGGTPMGGPHMETLTVTHA